MSARFSPKRRKDPSVKLNVRLPKENREVNDKEDESSIHENMSDKDSCPGDDKENESRLPTPILPPSNASSSELKQILQNQIHEEKLLEEQHGLLQKKLLHEYDRYARDCAMLDKELKMNVEMMDGQVGLNMKGSKPSTVVSYDLSSPDVVIPSYNRIYSKPKGTILFILLLLLLACLCVISVCVFVFVYMFVFAIIYLSVCLIFLSICSSVCLSALFIFLFVCVCLLVCLIVCVCLLVTIILTFSL